MSDAIVSLIRTYVPVAVGAFIAWLLSLGIEVDAETQAGLVVSMTGLVVAAYYTLIRLLERKWPAVGVLLGIPKQPEYEPRHAA